MIVAGLMSGTSLDGVDVAFVQITGKGWTAKSRTLAGRGFHYPPKLRQALLAISNRECHTRDIARMHYFLGDFQADCLLQAIQETTLRPTLAGLHGQTIFHEGQPKTLFGRPVRSTLQIAEPSFLAERIGIPVVSDFRARDIAAGGQGAPLAPYADYLFFRHKSEPRAALNIGGIANATILPPNATPDQITAFDTGPGNMVVDQLMAHFARKPFDEGGRWAAQGQPHLPLLRELLRNPFYRRPGPKSAGREQFGSAFVQRLLDTQLPPRDLVATATLLTARTIALGLSRASFTQGTVFVSGGGVHNRTLMSILASELPQCTIANSALVGIDPDFKEAAFFALLAYETWHARPSNMPSATGARHPVILGKITPP
jgi:anhydro-N-acetylmuramic acid kinase